MNPTTSANKPNLVILGAGSAGLSVAYYAHLNGLQSTLFEGAGSPGGLCRTVSFGAHRYDLGAHRFHDQDPAITEEVRSLLKGRIQQVTSPSRIYRWERYIDFPPTPIGLISSVPIGRLARIVTELWKSRTPASAPKSFEEYAVGHFGRTLAQDLLIDYSEKLWGLPASQLSPEIATKRLTGMTWRSLAFEVIKNSRKTSHIDGDFLYPLDGYGAIVEALAKSLPSDSMCLQARVTRIGHQRGVITELDVADERIQIDPEMQVVSTLPLSPFLRMFDPPLPAPILKCATGLRFRHIRLFYLKLGQDRFSEQASIYLPDPELRITRITEPKNRSSRLCPRGETGLSIEVPCFSREQLSQVPARDLFNEVKRDLKKSALLDPAMILDWEHRFLPNAYPVYDLDFQENSSRVLAHLESFHNLSLTGRQGRFYYSHLHHQMRMAHDLVERLAGVMAAS